MKKQYRKEGCKNFNFESLVDFDKVDTLKDMHRVIAEMANLIGYEDVSRKISEKQEVMSEVEMQAEIERLGIIGISSSGGLTPELMSDTIRAMQKIENDVDMEEESKVSHK